jgi:ribonuclease BN (tRNA processing enzyme)
MKVKVLGCSGGVGGSLRTTAFLVDDDILLDAGTGAGDLSLEQLARIDHVFITHSHLDHVACLPLMVDSVGAMRDEPLTVYATAQTIAIFKKHLFNWLLWPDFTTIPTESAPFMVFKEIAVGEITTLPTKDGKSQRKITAIPANHTVPAVGYLLESPKGALIFSGDTAENDALWEVANRTPNLKYLIIETAFSNKEHELAAASKHHCPHTLAADLAKLTASPEVLISHLKPGEGALTLKEIYEAASRWRPRMLENNQELLF